MLNMRKSRQMCLVLQHAITLPGSICLSKDACVCFPERQNLLPQAPSPLLTARMEDGVDCCEVEKCRGVFPPLGWELKEINPCTVSPKGKTQH